MRSTLDFGQWPAKDHHEGENRARPHPGILKRALAGRGTAGCMVFTRCSVSVCVGCFERSLLTVSATEGRRNAGLKSLHLNAMRASRIYFPLIMQWLSQWLSNRSKSVRCLLGGGVKIFYINHWRSFAVDGMHLFA